MCVIPLLDSAIPPKTILKYYKLKFYNLKDVINGQMCEKCVVIRIWQITLKGLLF